MTDILLVDILVQSGGYYNLQWRILKFTVGDILVHSGGYSSLQWRILYFTLADI